MKIKYPLLITLFFIFLLCSQGCPRRSGKVIQSGCNNPQTATSENTVRAVSLKVLQERLKACQPRNNCREDLLFLSCLKVIDGVIADEENQDLIIFGRSNLESPALRLEDFVVALKNLWLEYAPLNAGVHQYSFPACSIDPSPQSVRALNQIRQDMSADLSGRDIQAPLDKWRKACEQPQAVSVFGIPFNTRFAQVMVKADYDMKAAADGTNAVKIPGLNSIPDLEIHQARKELFQRKPVTLSSSGFNRFWFYPGENIYEQDGGVVFIKQCPVTLQLEDMRSNQAGELVGTGTTSPLARQFAKNFTALYDEVAGKESIYAELESLFRFVAVAGIIKERLSSRLELNLQYLIESYPVSQTKVDESLPGRHSVKELNHREETSNGYRLFSLRFPSCGGVDMAIDQSKAKIDNDQSGSLSNFKAQILKDRPSSTALYWDSQAGGHLSRDSLDSLVVKYSPEGYVVEYGNITPRFYKLGDMSEMVKYIEGIKPPDSIVSVSPSLKDFPTQAKEEAFRISYKRARPSNEPQGNLSAEKFRDYDDVKNAMHTRGAELDKNSTRIEAVPNEKSGLFNLTLKFLIRVKDTVQEVSVIVIAKTRSAAELFLSRILQFFDNPDYVSAQTLPEIFAETLKDPQLKGEIENIYIEVSDKQEGRLIIEEGEPFNDRQRRILESRKA